MQDAVADNLVARLKAHQDSGEPQETPNTYSLVRRGRPGTTSTGYARYSTFAGFRVSV